jgi:hypothetical protein
MRQKSKIVGCFTRLWLLSGDQSRPHGYEAGYFSSKPLYPKEFPKDPGGRDDFRVVAGQVTPAVTAAGRDRPSWMGRFA